MTRRKQNNGKSRSKAPRTAQTPVWDSSSEDEWAGDDEEYRIKKIVAEFPRLGRKTLYKIEWKDWKHPRTGESATWHPDSILDNSKEAKKEWDEEQTRRRSELAKSNPTEVQIGDYYRPRRARSMANEEEEEGPEELTFGAFFTFNNAIELENGTLEKIRAYQESAQDPWNMAYENPVMLLTANEAENRLPPPQRPPPKRRRAAATGPSSRPIQGRVHEEAGRANRSPVEQTASRQHSPSQEPEPMSISDIEKLFSDSEFEAQIQQDEDEDVVLDLDLEPDWDDRSPSPPHENSKEAVLDAWNREAESGGAEPIYFFNDLDDEEIPRLPEAGFTYLEATYDYAPEIPEELRPENVKHFLVGCDHRGPCSRKNGCQCIMEEDNYDKSGLLLKIPSDAEGIVECNIACGCTVETCRNRVSQRPRRFPVEIFKTTNRGWGVRSQVDIPRGAVLGFYTGLLVSNDDPRISDLPESSYSYKLDMHGDTETMFSISAYHNGNWTRFVNHSCEPLLKVVPMFFDTPQTEGSIPKLAYVSMVEIPAGTELTIDYDPNGGEESEEEMYDDEKNATQRCRCGAPRCRKIMSV